MTALLGERDMQYEITQEMDQTVVDVTTAGKGKEF